ncbi:MAG TPA: hypothetical protein VFE44_08130 [Thermoanaerobaculia bacterium]|nr:hypothetical protein [Thermoanaerobaculia bacterium]
MGAPPPPPWRPFELLLAGLFAACWLVILLDLAGLTPLAGLLDMGLYPLYGVAGLAGTLAGHAFVFRARSQPLPAQRRLLLLYLAGPPAVPCLLRAMAPPAAQLQAPLVPLWTIGVFAVFFTVPLLLRRSSL